MIAVKTNLIQVFFFRFLAAPVFSSVIHPGSLIHFAEGQLIMDK